MVERTELNTNFWQHFAISLCQFYAGEDKELSNLPECKVSCQTFLHTHTAYLALHEAVTQTSSAPSPLVLWPPSLIQLSASGIQIPATCVQVSGPSESSVGVSLAAALELSGMSEVDSRVVRL